MAKVSIAEDNALPLEDIANTIMNLGDVITFIIQGHMGSGKSTLLKMLAKMLPNHIPVLFDCTTKDMGDLLIPNLMEVSSTGVVKFAPNSELGLQHNKPIILLIDEIGKALPPVQRALNAVSLERKIAEWKLPVGADGTKSIVFATTNLGAEGVGDLMLAHSRNRYTIVRSRKPTNREWLENFAIPNKLDEYVLGWCNDMPELFQSFEQVQNPDDNLFIFHPAALDRDGVVTQRSLEKASNIMSKRHLMSDASLKAWLIGTIGLPAANSLVSFMNMGKDLPSVDDIKRDPHRAPVPSVAAQVMITYRTLTQIERNWVDEWFIYMQRLPLPMQSLFMQTVVKESYTKTSYLTGNAFFSEWCAKHNYAFTPDKKKGA